MKDLQFVNIIEPGLSGLKDWEALKRLFSVAQKED